MKLKYGNLYSTAAARITHQTTPKQQQEQPRGLQSAFVDSQRSDCISIFQKLERLRQDPTYAMGEDRKLSLAELQELEPHPEDGWTPDLERGDYVSDDGKDASGKQGGLSLSKLGLSGHNVERWCKSRLFPFPERKKRIIY